MILSLVKLIGSIFNAIGIDMAIKDAINLWAKILIGFVMARANFVNKKDRPTIMA